MGTKNHFNLLDSNQNQNNEESGSSGIGDHDLIGRINVGSQFVATHGPLRRLLDGQNVLRRNMTRFNPVANRALGFKSDLDREGLLTARDRGSPLDSVSNGIFVHGNHSNAHIVTPVNAHSGNAKPDNSAMQADTRKTFWQRLVEAWNDQELPTSGNAIAQKLDMSQGSVNRWQQGNGLPEMDTICKLAILGKVNVEWLLTGRGPKKVVRYDEETEELLVTWSQLEANGRHHVRLAAQSALALQTLQKENKSTPEPEKV